MRSTLVAAVLGLAAGAAPVNAADPGYYVVTPYPDAGRTTIEARYWTVKPRGGTEVVWPEVGASYGISSRWTSGLFWSGIGPSNLRVRSSTFNWWNTVLLTQGDWPVDVGLYVQAVRDETGGREHAVVFGPLLQTDFGRTQANLNLLFDRGTAAAASSPVKLQVQAQLRHRTWPDLHLGAMAFGELGPWRDWDPSERRSLRAGPAVFWRTGLGGTQALDVQAAWLEGRTYRKRGHMATLRAAFSF